MTSKEFVIWLKGFVAGSASYNLTPSGWSDLKTQLKEVNDNPDSAPFNFYSNNTFTTGSGVWNHTLTTQNLDKNEGTTDNMS